MNVLRLLILCSISLFSFICFGQKLENTAFKKDTLNWWKFDKDYKGGGGVSWNKAVDYLSKSNQLPKKTIVVSLMDSEFAPNHESLKGMLWVNNKELPDNNLDDDGNGYIDDINGWNFLGIKNKDSVLDYILMEESRILRKYDEKILNKLYKKRKLPYNYNEVKSSYDTIVKSLKGKIKSTREIESDYTFVMDTLQKLIKDKITLEILSNYKATNDTIQGYVDYAKYYYENDYPYDELIAYLNFKQNSLDFCMNLEKDSRNLVGDNQNSLKDRFYGNNVFASKKSYLEHGSMVSGVIASAVKDLNDSSKIENHNYPLKIMPIIFTGIGNFTDKDFYAGIRYAVDNGAKIINISQGKTFSLQPKVLKKAISYADKKGVLIVVSAGNESKDLDKGYEFPQSVPKFFNKNFSNLIIVGASTNNWDQHLLEEDTNFGKSNVDIFAPGMNIKTISPNDGGIEVTGTSYAAPIVANIAALIWSHYPDFSAKKIKQILIESGTSYRGKVIIPQGDYVTDEPQLLNFNELSKSGKIVNAYQALLLAKKISRN